tara:strand:- start:90 stop:683 length:594 start_codon:yes stop_codon:yes gene_type:complete
MTTKLLDNNARNHSHYTTSQRFLEKIDHLREFFLPIKFLDPKKLLTLNRLDIEYRINFLNNVLEKNTPFQKTLYYQFVSDRERNLFLSGDDLSKNFLQLFEQVKQNGIQNPIIVGKYKSENIKTQYFLNKKFIWKKYKNQTGYQLIDGAHRLSLALFLELDYIPVKIYSPLYFEIPNFTDYIALKEKEYKMNLLNHK